MVQQQMDQQIELTLKNKEIYVTKVNVDGSRYEGYWKNELRNGNGTYCFKNGAKQRGLNIYLRYIGNWVDDRMEGKGVYIGANEENFINYEGMWKDNFREG